MAAHEIPTLTKKLESAVLASTGNRLQKLGIEVSVEGIRLQGETSTFYVKQLATTRIRELMPKARLVNDIRVV